MTDIVRYQGASGDMNPIHHDDEFARSAGYREAFSVGMLSAGYLATACTDRFGKRFQLGGVARAAVDAGRIAFRRKGARNGSARGVPRADN